METEFFSRRRGLRASWLLLPILMGGAGNAAAVTHYRSIGSAPTYSVGTVRVVTNQPKVFGSNAAQWMTANRGRGDRINIGGVDYTVLSVDAENEITLTAPYTGPTSAAAAYAISRKFTRLKDWEECISAQTPCPGVGSANLVTDDRSEVGVVYKDSIFRMNTGGETLIFDGTTTDANHTITLTSEPSNHHHGISGTGVILDNETQGNPAIEIRDDFVSIEWIEIRNGDDIAQVLVTGQSTSNRVVLHHLILRDQDRTAYGIHTDSNEVHLLAYNNFVHGNFNCMFVDGLQVTSSAAIELFHNTCFGNQQGFVSGTSAANRNDVIFLKNNLGLSNPAGDFWTPSPNSTSSYNYSGDTTGPGASPGGGGLGSIPLASVRFVSTALGSENLHIASGSVAENRAPALPQVLNDIDGGIRNLPDVGADEASTTAAKPVNVVTSTSSNLQVELQWQNPDFGPLDRVEIRRSLVAPPAVPSDGALVCSVAAPAPRSKSGCSDGLVTNGSLYHYSAFVFDQGGQFSLARSVSARPFDPVLELPSWFYATGATTLAPNGIRSPSSFIVSNDNFLHATAGGIAPTSGQWPVGGPLPWVPYRLASPAQHRPSIVPVSGEPVAILGALDGRVYAVHAQSGRIVWKSAVLGGQILAPPAAMVAAFGATGGAADKVYVGTGDAFSNSLAILDLHTGALLGRFDDGGVPSNIGAIAGIAVKYPSGPVYFTSDIGSGGSPRSVWALNVSNPASPIQLWADNQGPVDAAPTDYHGRLLVGTRAGRLVAYDTAIGPPFLWRITYADGPVKAPIFPVWDENTVLFTTDTELHSVQIAATGGCGSPPCLNWTVAFGQSASAVVQVPGKNHAFVGLANGELRELTLDRLVPATLPASRSFVVSGSQLGGIAMDVLLGMLYVSEASGKVYGIHYPIP